MSFSKWIGGALGWSFGGPIGAIIGLLISNYCLKLNILRLANLYIKRC